MIPNESKVRLIWEGTPLCKAYCELWFGSREKFGSPFAVELGGFVRGGT